MCPKADTDSTACPDPNESQLGFQCDMRLVLTLSKTKTLSDLEEHWHYHQ